MIKTCEFVSPGHPDKLCDFIADSLLDAYMAEDPESRVAIEVMGGHGIINVSGEVTSKAQVAIEEIVKKIVGQDMKVAVHLVSQSSYIAQGVDTGGAGDQGIMVGYACRDTETFMPYEYEVARNLCKQIYEQYPYDGKVQVTVDGKKILTVVASFQNTKTDELKKLVTSLVEAEEYLINPAGEWQMGGFDADSGLSGRKIVIDAYGPQVSVGGGSFSGKDYTKVDRSGAYMARKLAVKYLQEHNAQEVYVKLAYAIGKAQPVMAVAMVDGKEIPLTDNLSPLAIRQALNLASVQWSTTCQWGHFGRGFLWDQV